MFKEDSSSISADILIKTSKIETVWSLFIIYEHECKNTIQHCILHATIAIK